jgi:hypothetical protein
MSPIWDTISNIWNNLVGGGAEPTESEQIAGYMGELAEADTGFTPSGGGGSSSGNGTISIPSVSQPTGGAFQPPISGAPTGGTGGFPSPAPGLQQPVFPTGQAPPVTQNLASQGIEGEGQPTPEQMQDPAWLAQHGGMAAPITSTDAAQFATNFMGGGAVAGITKILGKFGINSVSKTAAKAGAGQLVQTTLKGGNIASNTATDKLTRTVISTLTNNVAVGGMVITILGTYPFSYFVKEEALQTLGMGLNGAIENENWEEADTIVAMQEEFLNPDLQDKIIELIPFANVIASLKDFFKAAETKLVSDKTTIEKMKTGTDVWSERGIEAEAKEKEERAYWEGQAQDKQAQWEENQALMDEKKQKEQAYWAAVRNAENAKDAEERAYWEAQAKKRKEEAPSELGFGLL